MPGPAAAMAAGGAADAAKEVDVAGVADSAQKSKGLQIAVAVIGLAILYYVYTGVNFATDVGEDAADGAGEAAAAVGETAGDAYDGTQDMVSDLWEGSADAADGGGDVVEDGSDWWLGGGADAVEDGSDFFLGGSADAIRGTGDVVEDGTDYVLGGTADTVENVGSWAGGLVS